MNRRSLDEQRKKKKELTGYINLPPGGAELTGL